MIRFAEKKDMEQIFTIWQESFGDSREEIHRFFSMCGSDVRICIDIEDDIVHGFLCLISANLILNGTGTKRDDSMERQVFHHPAEYIYAVATDKRYRNRGICTHLLGQVKQILEGEHKCGILVPADPNLEQFYRKRGFDCCFQKSAMVLEKNQMTQKQRIDTEYSPGAEVKQGDPAVEQITVEEYILLRERALQGISHLQLSKDTLTYAIQSYLSGEGASACKIRLGEKEYAFLYRQNVNEQAPLFVQETTAVTEEDIHLALTVLLCAAEKEKAEVCISYPALGYDLPDGNPFQGCINLVMD